MNSELCLPLQSEDCSHFNLQALPDIPFVGNNSYDGFFYLSYLNHEPHWFLASSCLVLRFFSSCSSVQASDKF
jgi:hypothetical protein